MIKIEVRLNLNSNVTNQVVEAALLDEFNNVMLTKYGLSYLDDFRVAGRLLAKSKADPILVNGINLTRDIVTIKAQYKLNKN